jgi:hypothetical protein
MNYRMISAVGVLTLAFATGGCQRDATVEPRDRTAGPEAARNVDRAAELQRQHEEDLSKMDERVASLERRHQEWHAATPSGTSGTTSGLRREVKSDMDDVTKAVANLRTTTPENWWERHESALKTAFEDVESDVKRFVGTKALPTPPKNPRVADASGQPVSTEPFTSRRDKFVSDMRLRVNEMGKALDKVKATGPRKIELDDLHARVNKLGEDIDRLKSASAEDWWDLSKARVNDYIDRVEKSVARLDDHKR